MKYSLDPTDFNPKFHASGCIIESEGKFIMLRKTKRLNPGSFWALPAGKLDPGETPDEGLKREIQEETGIVLGAFEKFKTFNIRLNQPFPDFVYHIYKATVPPKTQVKLSSEHDEYKWVNKTEALQLNLETASELYLASMQ